MPIILPTTIQPATHINPSVLLIYGAPKVGKTSMLAQLDNCLILDLEKGSKYLAALKVSINSIEELKDVLTEIRKPEAPKYKYLAIDTVDMLEEWCEAVATRKYKATTVGKNFTGKSVLELEKGSGYLWLRMAFKEYFTMITQCCEQVIFVGHIRDKSLIPGDKILATDGTFKTVSNEAVSYRDLDLTGKVKSIACSVSDAIGHVFRDGQNKLFINFSTNDSVNCGSRCEHLKGKTFDFDWKKIYI